MEEIKGIVKTFGKKAIKIENSVKSAYIEIIAMQSHCPTHSSTTIQPGSCSVMFLSTGTHATQPKTSNINAPKNKPTDPHASHIA